MALSGALGQRSRTQHDGLTNISRSIGPFFPYTPATAPNRTSLGTFGGASRTGTWSTGLAARGLGVPRYFLCVAVGAENWGSSQFSVEYSPYGLGSFVTATVDLLLRVCYGSDLNIAPILPRCYGCYGSKGGGRGAYHVSILHVSILFSRQQSPLLHSTENSEEPGLAEWSPGGTRPDTRSDFGRAVSRILSSPKCFGGENHLSQQPVPGTHSALRNLQRATAWSPIWPCTRWGFPCLRACAWSGGLLLHLFTLTPPKRGGLFSVALSVDKPLDLPPACIHPAKTEGYAASRPLVFGLSSSINAFA